MVSVAGRMMLKRVMGKASFASIQDMSGRIQLYIANDVVGEEAYTAFKHYDLGDILGAEGTLFRTRTGELSVRVTQLRLLTKVPAASSRKIPWSGRPGTEIPPALPRPHHQRRQPHAYSSRGRGSSRPSASA